MIRSTTPLNLKRRIAVIRPAPTHVARLGSISGGVAAGPQQAYTTLSTMPAESSQSWMSLILMRQDRARADTPGTLFYTPANRTPTPNVAPWNSWTQPNCPPAIDTTPAPAAAAIEEPSKFWMAIGLLGAAASGLYILKNLSGDGKR